MKRFSLALVSFLVFLFPFSASAQGILPSTILDDDECEYILTGSADGKNILQSIRAQLKNQDPKDGNNMKIEDVTLNDVLACALRTGRVKLWMIPFFILSSIEFLSGLAGLLAVGYMVIGGYHYAIGGMTEEKDKGTKTIKNALVGFVLSMLAYTLVNIIQLIVSS